MFDIDNVPLDDKDTYIMLSAGLTKGVFQLESHLCKTWCKKIKPRNIDDLAMLVSLVRPGALNQADKLLRVRNLEEDPSYIDSRLEPILKKTYSIILYQEQTIKIAQDLAGFSEQEGDVLRKAIGKKDQDKLFSLEKDFVNGCMKNAIKQEDAEEMFSIIKASASYSFNASHAYSYAINAYRSAYLKCHYPTVFFWSALRCAKHKQRPLDEICEVFYDMEDFGVKLVPPSLSEMNVDFEVKDAKTILFGFSSIKGMGEAGVKSLRKISECEDWSSALRDIFSRKISKSKVEPAIKSGTMDHLGCSRAYMLVTYELVKSLTAKQLELFVEEWDGELEYICDFIESIPDKNKRLRISDATKECIKSVENIGSKDYNITKEVWERKYLGVNLTSTRIDDISDEDIDADCSSVKNMAAGSACVCGVLESVNKIKTRKDNKEMAFIEISDLGTKLTNIVVFPRQFNRIYYEQFLLRNPENELLKIWGDKKGESFIVSKITRISGNE